MSLSDLDEGHGRGRPTGVWWRDLTQPPRRATSCPPADHPLYPSDAADPWTPDGYGPASAERGRSWPRIVGLATPRKRPPGDPAPLPCPALWRDVLCTVRAEVYEAEERAAMKPLPTRCYELAYRILARTPRPMPRSGIT